MTNPQNKAMKFSIQQIVKQGFFFEIPPYQRLYEWGEVQIVTLLEDVKKAQEESKDIYFIGNVVVSKKDDRYILIDGQQRLTTLFLIGVYLASEGQEDWNSFAKSSSNKLRISMPLRENEEKWLLELINKGEKFRENLKSSPSVHKKIFEGLVVIQNWFDQNIRIRDVFSSFLYEKVCFALVELADKTDLNQFFVRMNNRGKQLEKHEILKARLLNKLKSSKREKYAKIWDLCSDMDKYIFDYSSGREIIKEIMGKSDDENIQTDIFTDEKQPPTLKDIITSSQSAETPQEEGKKEPREKKVESIIDFPTFLLHVAKLFIVGHCFGNESPKCNHKLPPINKNKLLEIICIGNQDQDSCGDEKFTFGTSERVIEFIDFMLKCRLAFDCFVIKRILDEELLKGDQEIGKRYAIGILGGDKTLEYKISNFTKLKELITLQDYLRLARSANQTYHHWLTSLLGFIVFKTEFLKGEIKQGENEDSLNIKEHQEHCYTYLKNLDTQLAIHQALIDSGGKTKLIDLVDDDLKGKGLECDINKTWFNKWCEEKGIENLNKGTGTPHYWFYRLEYYLMYLNLKENEDLKEFYENKKIGNKTFDSVVSNYRFRYVDSIEHIQPQSKSGVEEWKDEGVDIFGNLALISKDFNSSLNNQEVGDKYQDIVKRVNNGNIQSLKMFLAYASMKEDGKGNITWTPQTAKTHQTKMLKVLAKSLELDINNISKIPKQDI